MTGRGTAEILSATETLAWVDTQIGDTHEAITRKVLDNVIDLAPVDDVGSDRSTTCNE